MEIEDDEAESFLKAVRDVKRLEHNIAERQLAGRDRRAPISRVPEIEAPSITAFTRSGVQKTVLKKLRKGQIPIEEELDLHGYTTREAQSVLRAFLLKAGRAGRSRAVRVIHGKGLGSPNGDSVLKSKTQEWLQESETVLAFCSAASESGGSGAVHVLLRKK